MRPVNKLTGTQQSDVELFQVLGTKVEGREMSAIDEDEDEVDESSLRVFVRDNRYCWLPARLLSPIHSEDDTADVELDLPDDWLEFTCEAKKYPLKETRTVLLSDYRDMELPLQNIDLDGKMMSRKDMKDVPHLHEASVLYNLKERHKYSQPYTRVGEIIVAMNPFY
eukprot:103320-Ditylum_brightwellii.AAC.1